MPLLQPEPTPTKADEKLLLQDLVKEVPKNIAKTYNILDEVAAAIQKTKAYRQAPLLEIKVIKNEQWFYAAGREVSGVWVKGVLWATFQILPHSGRGYFQIWLRLTTGRTYYSPVYNKDVYTHAAQTALNNQVRDWILDTLRTEKII